MLASLALATVLQTPSAFVSSFSVRETTRLALTPKLDGKLSEEEWDRFAIIDGVQTYFQWQPGKLHGAATLPVGKDFVASFDLQGDGWLVGADNVEVRISWNKGAPTVRERILDATEVSQPKWVEVATADATVEVGSSSNGSVWTVEFSAADPGRGMLPSAETSTFAMRMDAVDSANSPQALTPRVVAIVRLGMERDGLPEGARFKPEYAIKSVVPGESSRVRLTFQGDNTLGFRTIEVRTEGLGKEFAQLKALPFPNFDGKGRALVDYDTRLSAKAPLGYRIVRGTITDGAGKQVLVQCSYEVAEPVSIEMPPPARLQSRAEEQKIRVSIYLKSNTSKRIDGLFVVQAPAGWTIATGNGTRFTIYSSRASARKAVEFLVPAGAKGTFPFKVTARIGLLDVSEVLWVRLP